MSVPLEALRAELQSALMKGARVHSAFVQQLARAKAVTAKLESISELARLLTMAEERARVASQRNDTSRWQAATRERNEAIAAIRRWLESGDRT